MKIVNMHKHKNGLVFLWITLIVFLADWGTKALAQAYLSLYDAVPVIPGFNLVLAYNRGAAFSFLSNASMWPNFFFGTVALGVSLALLVWLYKLPREERVMSIAFTLILGGALGNLWDRVRYEHVIDFVDLYVYHWHWPVFNLADAAVCIGAVLIIWKWAK